MGEGRKFDVTMTLVGGQIQCVVSSDKMNITEVTSCLVDCHRALAVQMASIIAQYFSGGDDVR